jgi:hypothetical protein
MCCAAGLTNPNLQLLAKRLGLGLAGGLLGGLLGSLVGSCMFGCLGLLSTSSIMVFLGRIVGWTLIGAGVGAGVGVSEGIVDRSFNKLRNGVIGGAVGGVLGGFFFGFISWAGSNVKILDGYDITGRALSFVLLGLSVGLFIGLAQVILKEAWITVEAGFRPGRQMILGNDLITMGTSEKSSMIFIAIGAKGVEPTHLKITRQDGRYLLVDNQSRTGTLVNGQPIAGPTLLQDGDAIQFGINVVRFKERVKHGEARLPASVAVEPPKPTIPAPIAATPKPPPVAPPKPAMPTASVAAPTPNAAKPTPAAPQPQEGRCPICDKKVVGIPGQRRCGKCFTTF